MRRIALGVAYDGGNFDGWQIQPSGTAVQNHLESALSVLAGYRISTVCAGRTDAGVHATGQVVHFDGEVERPLTAWVRGTNAHLPAGVSVQWASVVPADFHARFSALWREYEYRLYCAPTRNPLLHTAAWSIYSLDIDLMREAIAPLIGVHDFSSFRASQCQAATPIRDLMKFDITQQGPLIRFHIRGNAFLHHMVRNVVGSLVEVGLKRKPPSWLFDVLQAKNRSVAGRTFPAEGLVLVHVGYDSGFGFPESNPLLC